MNNDIYSSNGRLTSSPSTTAALEKLLRMPVTTPVNIEELADFSNVCRICAIMVDHVIPIFEGEGLQNKLEEKICKYLPIVVCRGDGLPRGVCAPCSRAVLGWHELAARALAADSALNARLLVAQGRAGLAANINKFISGETENDTKPTRRRGCPYCDERVPPEELRRHLVERHVDLMFHCDECDSYVDRSEFIVHMSLHVFHIPVTPAQPAGPAPARPAEADIKPTQMLLKIKPDKELEPKREKRNTVKKSIDSEENEFSDHSDRDRFDPLPEAVLRAIEDPPSVSPGPAPTPLSPAAPPRPEPPGRTRACLQCGKVYTAASSYFYHVKHAHSSRREHACATCDARFATRAGLAQHAAVHSAERRHACATCGARFRSRGALYIHAQTHGAAKRCVCATCGRAFRWQAALARHAARHRAERAHACGSCGRGFAVRADLLRHARTHAPRAAPCPHCARRFAQPRYLRAHLARTHPHQPHQPPPALLC